MYKMKEDKYSKYSDFLVNKKSYLYCQKLWKDTIESILPLDLYHEQLIDNQSIDGNVEMDGNPIYSVWVPELGYAIRIIQIERDTDNSNSFCSWINHTEYDNNQVIELVISIQLYNNSVELVRNNDEIPLEDILTMFKNRTNEDTK